MSRHHVEQKLVELTYLCEQMLEVLDRELAAMKSWQVERLQDLGGEKEALLVSLHTSDRILRAELESLAASAGVTPAELFSLPAYISLTGLRDRVQRLNGRVRQAGERNHAIASHVVQFLQGRTGRMVSAPNTGYSAGRSFASGGLLHQVV